MKGMLKLLMVMAFALLIAAPAAFAEIPERSTLPVTEPLDVGGTILQPGTYTISVLKRGDDNRVTIMDADNKTVATVLTIPHQLEPNEEIPNTMFVYYPAGEGQPRALRTWYPPDPASRVGRDIVYEESRAKQLARLANGNVVAYQGEIVDNTPLHVITPQQTIEVYTMPAPTPAPVVTPAPMTSAAPVETAEAAPVEMPKTAGNIPMIALFGFVAAAGAVGVRFLRQ